MPAPKALVVDDEPQMRAIVAFALETQGFTCLEAGTAETAWRLIETTPLDLIVLDVMLPGSSGISLCRRVRNKHQVPIILLTARGEVGDRVEGLEAGADDYVTKPFSPRELALRAQAIVRRSTSGFGERLVNGALQIDLSTGRIFHEGHRLILSDVETRLLVALARDCGEVVGWRQLLNDAWDTSSVQGGREMIKSTIYRLRQRLEEHGIHDLIESVRGTGYRMRQVDESPSSPGAAGR